MPDISMCENAACPKHDRCYRFTATPDSFQSYGSFKPDAEGQCKYFWPTQSQEASDSKTNGDCDE